jgi:single-stranded-DNA-specific exonuclease
MQPKKWFIKPAAPRELLAQYQGISPVLAQVLYNRELTSPRDAARFLGADVDNFNPFKMKDMNKAVARISTAIKNREPIVVYGDFDADGVTSTALLVQTLKALGANVRPYIPHRVDEGYGLNSEALHKLKREGMKLVITVDCGIRSVQDVEDGKAYGLDIIITDHHSLGPEIPNAYAVINPKQEDCDYPEDMLAGVGIAYKLADALLRRAKEMDKTRKVNLTLDDLVDLVAIGTVADLAPLNRAENRALVRRGLEMLNQPKRLGLQALINVAGARPGLLNTTSIGFALGPRINAAGRLGSAMIAYDLLMSSDSSEAERLALELQELNVKRQELTKAAQNAIRVRLEAEEQTDALLIFASDSSFQPGIVGLVAGRLTEEFYRPAIVMEVGEVESRASCRSIPQFDITQALDQCADLLVRHGGHAQAAGFTILNSNLPAFKERLMDIAKSALEGQDLKPTLEIDAEVDARLLTIELAHELALLEPCGHSNNMPVFIAKGLRVHEYRTVGKTDDHLKLRLTRPGQLSLDGIGFGLGAWAKEMPNCVDVAFQLEINDYNGSRTLQMNMQDIRPAGAE